MKSALLCLCLVACLAGAALARDDKKKGEQPRPDFSGRWQLDRSKSDFGAFSDRPLSKADSTLVVEHRDPS